MKARSSVIALASIALISAPVLAACSGSSSDESTSASPSMSAAPSLLAPSVTPSATETGPLVGGDPSTWTPVSITQDMNGDKVKIVVGQFANFDDLPAENADNKIVLRAKKKGVVDISQPTANSKAGFQGVAKGKTRITVWDGKPSSKSASIIMYIMVKVKKAPAETTG